MPGRFFFYADTSIFGFLFEREDRSKQQATEEFFHQVEQARFRLAVSALVIDEIARTPLISLRDQLLALVEKYQPTQLEFHPEIERLAQTMVDLGAIPKTYVDDARHVAYAMFYRLDGIVSWNLRHIVRFSTRRKVAALCRMEGYSEIDLLTPEEVIYETRG